MSTWTNQAGFPMVQVSSEQRGPDRVLTLTQQKFSAYGCETNDNSLWMVPITISTQEHPDKIALSTVLEKRTQEVVLENVSECSWVKLNPGRVGYYRTRYSATMREQLVQAACEGSLPPVDCIGLINDSCAFVKAGYMQTAESLKLMEAFSNETNFQVWYPIFNYLDKLNALFSHTDLDKPLKNYGRQLLASITRRVGWDAKEKESHLDSLLRNRVLCLMVDYEDPDTLQEAKTRFEAHVSGKCTLPADLRPACYRAALGAAGADAAVVQRFLQLYRAADLYAEKYRISRALGAIKDADLLKKVLDFAASDEVRYIDAISMIASVSANRHGRDLVWQFFKKHWQLFKDRHPDEYWMEKLVQSVTDNLASEAAAQEIEQFFGSHQSPSSERPGQWALETVRLNAAWLSRDLASTTAHLQSYH